MDSSEQKNAAANDDWDAEDAWDEFKNMERGPDFEEINKIHELPPDFDENMPKPEMALTQEEIDEHIGPNRPRDERWVDWDAVEKRI